MQLLVHHTLNRFSNWIPQSKRLVQRKHFYNYFATLKQDALPMKQSLGIWAILMYCSRSRNWYYFCCAGTGSTFYEAMCGIVGILSRYCVRSFKTRSKRCVVITQWLKPCSLDLRHILHKAYICVFTFSIKNVFVYLLWSVQMTISQIYLYLFYAF